MAELGIRVSQAAIKGLARAGVSSDLLLGFGGCRQQSVSRMLQDRWPQFLDGSWSGDASVLAACPSSQQLIRDGSLLLQSQQGILSRTDVVILSNVTMEVTFITFAMLCY